MFALFANIIFMNSNYFTISYEDEEFAEQT